jgi:hypothetical protein
MIKQLIAGVSMVLLAATPFASAASIKINFEEFAYGVSVGDYYNGGQDSLGRASGAYYGVTFDGGTIKNMPIGAYLSGSPFDLITIRLNPDVIRTILGTDRYYMSFNIAAFGDVAGVLVPVYFENGSESQIMVSSNANPMCPEIPQACNDGLYGSMWGAAIGANGYDGLIRVTLPAYRLDNVELHAYPSDYPGYFAAIPPTIRGTYDTTRDIPEPASIALVGIGAAALLARRRARKGAASR